MSATTSRPSFSLLEPLDLVERDDGAVRGTGRRSPRSRQRIVTTGPSRPAQSASQAPARELDDRLDLGPARAAAGPRARRVADGLHAARAAQHRLDDLRLRHGVAVADARRVRDRRRGRAAASLADGAGETAARRGCRPAASPDANACSSDGTIAPSPMTMAPASRSLRTISFL